MTQRLTTLLALACALLPARSAHAHPTPGSVTFVDFTIDGARIEQDVPLEELERALHLQLAAPGETGEHVVRRHESLLRDYVCRHLWATDADSGAEWTAQVIDVIGHDAQDGPRVRFRFALRAPDKQAARSIVLHDQIVAHEVISHYTRVYVRSDWSAGEPIAHVRLAGTIHAGINQVAITRAGSFWRGFGSVVSLGIEHILTGSDHLVFLFLLLLSTPLTAAGASGHRRRSSREAGLALVRVVTAFTVGHSLTLALGALGWYRPPAAPVEAAIAVTILITAFHLLRPTLGRSQPLLTAAFGLVHGLGLATVLMGRDLGQTQALWTLLGVNLGIELAQLGLVSMVAPWVLLLARTRFYDAFRVLGACTASALALGWLLERTTGSANPFATPLAWFEAHPLQLLVGLALAALVARVVDSSPRAA